MIAMSSPVLRDQVCDVLRARIISGELPPSSGLREVRLASELGVSRTPLREAIRQLTEEGFVEQSPRRGARVVALSPEMIREVYEVREALEGMAARHAALRIDAARITFLRNLIDDLRPRIAAGDLTNTGDRVHEEIFEVCGNSRLKRLMSLYRSKVSWIQGTAFRISQRLEIAYQEHESIVRALECHDPEWAEAATRRHIRNTLAELVDLLAPAPRPDA